VLEPNDSLVGVSPIKDFVPNEKGGVVEKEELFPKEIGVDFFGVHCLDLIPSKYLKPEIHS